MTWLRLSVVLAVFAGGLAGLVEARQAAADPPPPTACDEIKTEFLVPVAQQRPADGVWIAGGVMIPLTGNPDWGDRIVRRIKKPQPPPTNCDSGKANCKNEPYGWIYSAVDNDFRVTQPSLVGLGDYEFTIADVEAFYEHNYPNQTEFAHHEGFLAADGWEKVDPADLNYNCHGYAFGQNVWIEASNDGVGRFLDGVNPPACYPIVAANVTDTKYAVQVDWSHSTKMKIEMVQYGPGMLMPKATERWEKNGFSAVYKLIKPGAETPDVRTYKPKPGQGLWRYRKDPP